MKDLDTCKAVTKDFLADLTAIDAASLASVKGTDNAQHHRFEVQTQLYDLADKLLVKKGDPATQFTGSLDDAFTKSDKEYDDAVSAADRLSIQATGDDGLARGHRPR